MPDNGPQDEDKQSISSLPEITDLSQEDQELEADLSDAILEEIPGKEKLYGRSILSNFSFGMVDPFLTTIAVDMGISGSQMGWLRAITNLLGNFVQPVFGFLSDTIQRRSIFVALSNILYSSAWILLLFVNQIWMIIFMAGMISLVVSMGTPAWTALLGEVVPSKIRGKIIAKVNWFSQFSYIASTILGGIILNYVIGNLSMGSRTIELNMLLTISIGLLAGLISAIIIMAFNEKKARDRGQRLNALLDEENEKLLLRMEIDDGSCIIKEDLVIDKDPQDITASSQDVICVSTEDRTKKSITLESDKERSIYRKPLGQRVTQMLKNRDFMKFTIIFAIQSFFMSYCWPLFPIRQRSDIAANFFEIAVFSVVMSLASLLTVRYAGRISDLIGRKTQIFLNRLILVTMPLSYMFASQVWHIILIHAIICIPLGLNSAVMQAYLIDITPEEERSFYVGFYNMFYGLVLFLGSLAGGYMADFLMGEITIFGYSPFFVQFKAITIAFSVGFVGRLLTAIPFLLIKDVKSFPFKLKDLPRLVLKSKKLIALIALVSFFFGIIFLYVGLTGFV
ncbi:MAG: MFS transporter [Asgard group archaeon]|nr:MFS transporter [Asgard group archaeon]